jgi:DNA-binding MarR family transcriptional regulator
VPGGQGSDVQYVDDERGGMPPAPALLRRPALLVRQQILDALHAAGFRDILPAHLGVFQYPGPEGRRPGELAARTRASKQAMNHLLHQLEIAGYLTREAHPRDRRTRVVRLTERGWAALEVIRTRAREIEAAWTDVLGDEAYRALRQALERLDSMLDEPTQID